MRRIFLTAAILLLPALTWAQSTVLSSAGFALPIDDVGVSARANVLGSAFVGLANDSSALFWNPAGLGLLDSGEIALHHNSWLTDIYQETVVLALPVEYGTIGGAVDYVNYGSFEGRDSGGGLTPSYTANNLEGALGWGMELVDKYFAGATVKFSQLTMAGQSSAVIACNVGMMKQIGKNIRLGISYSNLGTAVSGSQTDSALRLGGSYSMRVSRVNRVYLALGAQVESNGMNQIQFGAEDIVYSILALRAGYQFNQTDQELDGMVGFRVGVGFSFQSFVIDYAYLPYGDLGNSNQVSVSYLF